MRKGNHTESKHILLCKNENDGVTVCRFDSGKMSTPSWTYEGEFKDGQ